MSAQKFVVTEHWSSCQFVREYPHAVKQEDANLFLAVKECRPRHDAHISEDAVTIIASPGNGFPKECYEALWEEILDAATGFQVRSIWIADCAHQGASYTRNAALLGDDPCWMDHSRDLLLMVNNFRDKMKPPFVGIAHSMGCAHIHASDADRFSAQLALFHPRLFHTLVFIDPVIADGHPPGPNAAMLSSLRRENWPSREKAEQGIKKSPMFKSFDPRILPAYLAHGLKERGDGSVTLATPKAQEAWSFLRSNFHPIPQDTTSRDARYRERLINPEFIPFQDGGLETFARGDSKQTLVSLPSLRPRAFYLFGRHSHINTADQRKRLLALTGTGPGGNGGVPDGGTEMKVIDKTTHFLCFETPKTIAIEIGEWLAKEVIRWQAERDFWAQVDTGKSKNDKKELSEKWIEMVKRGASIPRPGAKAVAKL